MFATLVLALPSASEGGELVVRHNEREARLDMACDDPSEVAFAAFYADCVHEVLPVTKGCRATLVFNLIRKSKAKAPEPPSYEPEAERVTELLGAWSTAAASQSAVEDEAEGPEWPLKIVYPLEHAYTPAELSFSTLKGADAAVTRLLAAATPGTGVDLHLALLTIEERGSAEYTGSENWHYRRGHRDAGGEESNDEFKVIEVFYGSRSLSDWRRPDGVPTALGNLPVEDDEIAPSDALEDMEPDEEHFHEATGNEGASFDRTYRRAALVLWPTADILAVLNQAGLAATLPYLDDLLTKWKAAGVAKGLQHHKTARELAGHMLGTWPNSAGWGHTSLQSRATLMTHARERPETSDLGKMLGLLTRLGDKALVEAAIEILIAQRRHDKVDNPALLGALELFPLDRAANLLEAIVASNAIDALGPCGALLADAVKGAFAKKSAQLTSAASVIIEALPGDLASEPKDQWDRPRVARPDAAFVADFAGAVDRIDGALAKRAAAHILAWPRHFDPDAVLVPAIKRLLAAKRKGGSAFEALHSAAISHLAARIGLPLEAPTNWIVPKTRAAKGGAWPNKVSPVA